MISKVSRDAIDLFVFTFEARRNPRKTAAYPEVLSNRAFFTDPVVQANRAMADPV